MAIYESKYYCSGCEQEIDIDLTHHIWDDEDDDGDTLEVYYHVDCCPGKHVSEGDCSEVLHEDG